MASSLTPSASSTESRKRKQNEELASVGGKRERITGASVTTADNSGSDGQQPITPNSTPAFRTNGNLFDRPSSLVTWELRSKAIHPSLAPHQQRQTTGRFYTTDSSLVNRTFFDDKHSLPRAHVIIMMETNLGMEYYGDDRCQTCVSKDIPCVRYIEGAKSQITNCGSSCAWCRCCVVTCSKANYRKRKKADELDGEASESHDPTFLDRVKTPTRPAVNNLVGATTTPDEIRQTEQEAVTQGTSESSYRYGRSASETIKPEAEGLVKPLSPPGPHGDSVRHPILRLEDLINELSEDDAQEAQALIIFIKRNLEKSRDIKGHASLLKNLFAPVKERITGEYYSLSEAKQRVADKYKRISKDMAQAAEKKKLLDDADEAPDAIKVEE